MSLKLYTDKTELFECNVALEGAAISDSKLRAVLKFDDKNLMVEGKIDSNGNGNILLPKLKNISKSECLMEGIENIDYADIKIADQLDFRIKLLAITVPEALILPLAVM